MCLVKSLFFFFFLGHYLFFPFFLFSFSFDLLGRHHPVYVAHIYICFLILLLLLLLLLLFFGLDVIFFWTWFLFFNKFRWLLIIFGCLSLFCFNLTSYFNKNIWVNLYKLTFLFLHFLTLNQTKMRVIKIFFILPFFHLSNQTNP